jgi:hypothetical protein
VGAKWFQVAWLVKKPDPFPFVKECTEILRRKNQLLGPARRISRVSWHETAGIRTDPQADNHS